MSKAAHPTCLFQFNLPLNIGYQRQFFPAPTAIAYGLESLRKTSSDSTLSSG